MGFVRVHYDDDGNAVPGWPMATVRLEHLEPSNDGPFAKVTWRMLEDLGYELPDDVDGSERFIVAPAHEVGQSTDLASVPPWLWGVIASFGRHTLAALLHDHLCEQARTAAPADAGPMRREADRLFRVTMFDLDVPAPRAWVMWAAVRLFGEKDQPGWLATVPAAVVLVASLAVTTGLVALAAGSSVGGRLAVVSLLATLAGAAVAGTRGRRDLVGATLIGGIAGPLVAPALLVSLATALVVDGPVLVGWALRKLASRVPRSPVQDPGAPPRIGPMRVV